MEMVSSYDEINPAFARAARKETRLEGVAAAVKQWMKSARPEDYFPPHDEGEVRGPAGLWVGAPAAAVACLEYKDFLEADTVIWLRTISQWECPVPLFLCLVLQQIMDELIERAPAPRVH